MSTRLTDHLDRMARQRDNDPEHRQNRREIAAKRRAAVGGTRSALGDAIGRTMNEAAREDAVEAVADARDQLRRLKRADAPRREIEDARENLKAARQRRDELATR